MRDSFRLPIPSSSLAAAVTWKDENAGLANLDAWAAGTAQLTELVLGTVSPGLRLAAAASVPGAGASAGPDLIAGWEAYRRALTIQTIKTSTLSSDVSPAGAEAVAANQAIDMGEPGTDRIIREALDSGYVYKISKPLASGLRVRFDGTWDIGVEIQIRRHGSAPTAADQGTLVGGATNTGSNFSGDFTIPAANLSVGNYFWLSLSANNVARNITNRRLRLDSTYEAGALNDIVIAGPDVAANTVRDSSEPYDWDPGQGVSYVKQEDTAGSGVAAWISDYRKAYSTDNTIRAILVLDDGVRKVDAGDAIATASTAYATPVPLLGEIDFGVLSVMGVLDVDNISRVPVLRPRDNLRWLISQYGDARRLRSLLGALLDISDNQVVQPLMLMNRGFNPDSISGILLDWLGSRLAFPRPFITSGERSYFGFLGTQTRGGATFGQAPFYTPEVAIEDIAPIGDATYRLLLKARARRLRNDAHPNRETYAAILAILFGNGHLDESGTQPVLRVRTTNDLLFTLAQRNLEKLFPRRSGTSLTLVRIT